MRQGKRWNEQERLLLKDLYKTHPCYEIARRLGRTEHGVRLEAFRLKLKANNGFHIRDNWRFIEGNPYERLSERDKAYIAGVFDGEGDLTRAYDKYWRLGFTNTNKELIDWLEGKIYYSKVFWRKKSTNFTNGQYRDIASLTLYGNLKVKRFLEVLLPFLIVKKAKAEAALKDLEYANI